METAMGISFWNWSGNPLSLSTDIIRSMITAPCEMMTFSKTKQSEKTRAFIKSFCKIDQLLKML